MQRAPRLLSPRPLAGALILGVGAVAVGHAGERPPRGDRFPPDVRVVSVGAGPERVQVLTRRTAPVTGPTVLFLHGWRATDPVSYRPWLVHLARRGARVVYPAYQSRRTPPRLFLAHLAAGLRAADRRFPTRRLVVAGHSVGATLALDYASDACRLGLPAPEAVMAIYPRDRVGPLRRSIPLAPWRRMPRAVPVLVLRGARDLRSARGFARRTAAQIPGAHLETVWRPAAATHLAPHADTPAARAVFWARLDALDASAIGRGGCAPRRSRGIRPPGTR